MDPMLTHDRAHLTELLEAAEKAAARGLAGIDDRPAASAAPAPGPTSVPERGVGALAALETFLTDWEPGFSGSAGPRYLGFVTGGATPASVVGDWLASAYDQNAAAHGDSRSSELEQLTVAWLAQLFGLGPEHSGAFVTGATVSNTVGLAIGREWIGERLGVSVTREGVGALGPVTVLSGAPHSSIAKSLAVLGLGRDALQRVPLQPGREAVDVARLEQRLAALNGRPAIVVANAGTVDTVDFDDLRAIAGLRERYPFWLHVDGAFGAFAALSPDYEHLVDGIDLADSICFDLHKWLNVPYDAGVQFTKRRDLQVAVYQNTASYLSDVGDRPDYIHLGPENSRRLRALPAWFTLTAYGRDGHREIVERDIALAQQLGARIAESRTLRLLAPVRLNVVCFTLADDPTSERVTAFVEAVAAGGDAFVTPTVYRGTAAVRAAFSNWRTTDQHLDRVVAALERAVVGS